METLIVVIRKNSLVLYHRNDKLTEKTCSARELHFVGDQGSSDTVYRCRISCRKRVLYALNRVRKYKGNMLLQSRGTVIAKCIATTKSIFSTRIKGE